ncbi:unnamed protein product, partial [Phyllotreta striolata]
GGIDGERQENRPKRRCRRIELDNRGVWRAGFGLGERTGPIRDDGHGQDPEEIFLLPVVVGCWLVGAEQSGEAAARRIIDVGFFFGGKRFLRKATFE